MRNMRRFSRFILVADYYTASVLVVVFILSSLLVVVPFASAAAKCESATFFTTVGDGTDLVTVDLATGSTKNLGEFVKSPVESLAFDHGADRLYGLLMHGDNKRYSLVTVEETSMPTQVRKQVQVKVHKKVRRASNNNPITGLVGLAFNEGGNKLYAHSEDDRALYEIEPKNAKATKLYDSIGGIVDLTFDSSSGLIFAATPTKLYKMNPGGSRPQLVGTFSNGAVIAGIAPDPENSEQLTGIVKQGTDPSVVDINKNNAAIVRTRATTSMKNVPSTGAVRCVAAQCSPRESNANLQPKITIVEGTPVHKAFYSSLSLPQGSPWCQGQATFWEVGHQPKDETPFCRQGNGQWSKPHLAIMGRKDEANGRGIDRHSCCAVDVDGDGVLDAICVIGANRGIGFGYTELYLTQPDTGGIIKVEHHGMQVYSSVRGRLVVPVSGAGGKQLVFAGSSGTVRTDGRTNVHYMYEVTHRAPDYFARVNGQGLWEEYIVALCAVPADINGDGIQDLVLCNAKGAVTMFQQNNAGKWSQVPVDETKWTKSYRNLRVRDVTGDGRADLVAVNKKSWVMVFVGIPAAPYFDFDSGPLYVYQGVQYTATDVELVDADRDGKLDIYVVERKDDDPAEYCGGDPETFWGNTRDPPDTWAPPNDVAQDALLVNRVGCSTGEGQAEDPFYPVKMQHSLPGCGSKAERFGNDQTMTLAHGEPKRPGFNVVLEW